MAMQEQVKIFGGQIKILYSPAIDHKWWRDLYATINSLMRLPRLLKQYSVDAVIFYNLGITNLLMALLSKALDKRIYFEYEDSIRITRFGPKPFFLKWYFGLYEVLARSLASGSFSASKELAQAFEFDSASENCLVIPGVLAHDITQFAIEKVKMSWNPERPIRLIYAGGLDASKGLDRFLEAFSRLQASDSLSHPIEMCVCGSGSQDRLIEELCKHSLKGVNFLGVVSRVELIERLCWADIGINPHRSDLHAGGTWPFKVIEYLVGCGTVFCSNTNDIDDELAKQLFLYDGNTVDQIESAILALIKHWPVMAQTAQERRSWAVNHYCTQAIGVKLSTMLRADNDQ
jgi:glycosyltransferase involved in cell wall biosynthesis